MSKPTLNIAAGARSAAVAVWCLAAIVVGPPGCRPSDVLSVPPPASVTPSAAFENQTGGEGLLVGGRGQVFFGLDGGQFEGVLPWSSVLSDEGAVTQIAINPSVGENIDARETTAPGFYEPGDAAIQGLMQGRLTLLSAIPILERYEPASGQSKIGEAFALVGYVSLLLAEDYCAGVPLGALGSPAGVEYGTPLSTDSLLGAAEADFDSASAHAAGDPAIASLAAVGLGRARLDRGHVALAAAAVSTVATSFVYNTELQPGSFGAKYNMYDEEAQAFLCGYINVGDHKGGNGLNYISAQDPRLVLSTTVAETCDGLYGGLPDSVWYYPVKFGNPPSTVPLATGVEARLIEAEAGLSQGDAAAWATILNTLRSNAPSTYLALVAPMNALTPDSTTSAASAMRVDVMFRERAFWLYGIGSRLGDLRRLIRQYGRDQSAVFPAGPYPNGNNPRLPSPLPNYGADVSLPLPTAAGGLTTQNPRYKGCLTSTKTA